MSTAAWIIGAALAAAALLIALRDRIRGENLLLDAWDARRIARADLDALDRACERNPNRSDVVVSLTTTPSRMPHIAATLKSLLRQTRAPREIRLNVPQFSRREGVEYVVPEWLARLHMVRVVRTDDSGPATKFIPALLSEPADRLVMVVDDDRIYPGRLIEWLEAAALRDPASAFGACGWIVPADMTDHPTWFSNVVRRPPAPVLGTTLRRPMEVDILKGVAGYIVRPRFFDRARLCDYSGAPPEAYDADDIWLSGLCSARKYVIPTRRADFHPPSAAAFFRATSLGRLDADKRKNSVVLQYFGADCWRVGGPRNAPGAPDTGATGC